MNRTLASATAIPLLSAGLVAACSSSNVLAGLDDGLATDSGSRSDATGGSSIPVDGSGTSEDAAFVCTPPANSTQPPITFTGTRFDKAQGCLVGAPITLPICGCFNGEGLDSMTWCFVAPDGTTYFGISADACTVLTAPGWYATTTTGPDAGGPMPKPTTPAEAACARVSATSTAMGSYDRPGPPKCDVDGGMPPTGEDSGNGDAGICVPGPINSNPAGPCTVGDNCNTCIDGVAGLACHCTAPPGDGGADGADTGTWACIGTGSPCDIPSLMH